MATTAEEIVKLEGLLLGEGVPEPDAVLEAPGQSCAILTLLIRARISDLDSGKVLEVRSDDPAAREGVPAWSWLTGNEWRQAPRR